VVHQLPPRRINSAGDFSRASLGARAIQFPCRGGA